MGASVQRINLESTNLKLGDNPIYELHIMNDFSSNNIHVYAGFGYLDGRNVVFSNSDSDLIGSPLPGESIYPFGDIRVTQNVYDDYFSSKDIKFYGVCGHLRYNTFGEFIMDSYKSVEIIIEYAPTEPLALVESVLLNTTHAKIGDTVQVSGRIKNGGAAGSIKWNCCIGYETSPGSGSVTIMGGDWKTTHFAASQTKEMYTNVEITKEMFERESQNNVLGYCLGSH